MTQHNKMLSGKDFFYCYDYNLSDYLSNNGIRYITKAISSQSYKTYRMYLITDELDRAIQQFKRMGGASGREFP